MVFDPTNTNQIRTWIKDAPPEELLTIAPVLFNRIGTLEQNHQERFVKDIKGDPQAKRVFEKIQSFA